MGVGEKYSHSLYRRNVYHQEGNYKDYIIMHMYDLFV